VRRTDRVIVMPGKFKINKSWSVTISDGFSYRMSGSLYEKQLIGTRREKILVRQGDSQQQAFPVIHNRTALAGSVPMI